MTDIKIIEQIRASLRPGSPVPYDRELMLRVSRDLLQAAKSPQKETEKAREVSDSRTATQVKR